MTAVTKSMSLSQNDAFAAAVTEQLHAPLYMGHVPKLMGHRKETEPEIYDCSSYSFSRIKDA